MYNDFFGFREQPFNVTPDPHVFYATPSYQRIYNNLVHSIREGKSLSVMIGEVGTGKTTMLRRIMRDLEDSVLFAYFTYTTLPFDDLLNFLCQDLEVPLRQEGQLQTLKALQEFLITLQGQGHTAALLIDEAQNLQESVLEEIRHLLNLTTESKTLLPVILVGQPELERKLAQPAVYQLKQRVTLNCQLDRLKERDVGPFIAYRLQAAECMRDDIFTPEAIQRIAFHSQGVPRLINILCNNALLLGYSISEKTISAETIEEISQDLGLQKTSPVLQKNQIVHSKEEMVSAQIPPLASQEVEPPQLHVPSVNALTTTADMHTGSAPRRITVTRTDTNKRHTPRRTSSRWIALAGTGLAFALWFFTLFPYGESKDPFVPSIPPAGQDGHMANISDNGAGTFVPNELGAMAVHSDSDKGRLPAKEADSVKKNRKADPIQTKEGKTSLDPAISAISPLVITNSQGKTALQELTEKKPSQFPEQLPSTQASDSPSAHESLLIEAASQGDVEQGERLLSAGIVPDVVDESGWTALMTATLHGYSPMVELLLKKGADVNLNNPTGGTALMMAAIQGQNEILQLLLERGAKVNVQDTKGWTALMYAARNGHTTTVQILLSSGAEVDLMNTDGRTALMYATARGHKETARALQDGKAGGTMFN
jgi:general secretion pathway protein A